MALDTVCQETVTAAINSIIIVKTPIMIIIMIMYMYMYMYMDYVLIISLIMRKFLLLL